MKKRDIINVNVEFESLLDIMLIHVKEDRCTHSIDDLINQFLDKNKDSKKVTKVQTSAVPLDNKNNNLNQQEEIT